MVTTKSGSDTNRVTITNNFAKYYADSALEYANQAKMYADDAKQTESELTQFIANSSLSTISDNIENINYLAENIQNLDGLSFEWGKITGDITQQADLKLVLENKANINELSSVATSGSYLDLTDVPTNVSEFINDIGYLTEHQDISGKADIENVYTKIEIDTKLGEIEILLEGV